MNWLDLLALTVALATIAGLNLWMIVDATKKR